MRLKTMQGTMKICARINHNLGNSYLKENKLEQAIEEYKSSLRLNPNDEETRYNLAYAQKMKQQQEQQTRPAAR